MRRLLVTSVVLAGAAGLAGCDPYFYNRGPQPYADPQGAPTQAYGQAVSVLGCPVPAAQPNCSAVRGVDGRSYDISGAQTLPDPRSPFAVEISGVPGQGNGYCQGGVTLQGAQVRQSNLRCVAGVVQGYTPAY